MQIALGRRGDYAVRSMIALARAHGTGRRKARQIAELMDIPERFLPQVVAPLVRGGLVIATAGPDGGYALARPPQEITLLDVVEASEGPVSGSRCLLQGGPCDWEQVCPAHYAWSRAHAALSRELRRTTLKELADNDARIEAGTFEVPEEPLHPESVERRGLREPGER